MSKLYIKSETQNTIGEERLDRIAEGKSVMAAEYGSGQLGVPRLEAVGVSDERISGNHLSGRKLDVELGDPVLRGGVNMSSIASGFDVEMPGLGMSVREAVENGLYGTGGRFEMDGSSLIENWQSLWDAMRIDLTVRKTAKATVRELIYNVVDRPDADRVENINEFFPHFFEFVENDGTGQAVDLGELRGGQVDTITQQIYAAGLKYDLQKALFDKTLNMQRVNDGIATAESGKKDDIAIKPIVSATYAGGKATAADTTSGATREELLYKTMANARDDLGIRRDPITDRRVPTTNLIVLTDPLWGPRINDVLDGNIPASPGIGRYSALTGYSRVIGYEGERLVGNTKTVTYTDIPANTAYVIAPNRRMLIGVKRNLQLDVNMNPNPLNLDREERAWWFCEGIYNDGINYFIQKVTMPTW
jgi:hypothetical protein